MINKEGLVKAISKQETWSLKNLKNIIDTLDYPSEEESSTNARKKTVGTIKKYDVVYMQTMTSAHYILVYKVDDDFVLGVVLSSKNKDENFMHEVMEDRWFKGNFVTNTLMQFPKELCLKSYSRRFESISEANTIFKKLKNFYKKSFNL